jgi:hypothetical protein
MVSAPQVEIFRQPMGADSILLVSRRAVLGAMLSAAASPVAKARPVVAEAFDSFWLWAGVRSQPVIDRAKTLYCLQGEVVPTRKGQAVLVAQAGASPHRRSAQIWLTYRVNTLDWPPDLFDGILRRLARWRLAGQPAIGLQIDFDSGTHHLDRYARFLQALRERLPPDYKLSITGLLDWSSKLSRRDLASLAEVADEIVLQTYQGRRTIPDYRSYIDRLASLHMPFKIGLVQHGEWDAPEGLDSNPLFQGYVVFLVNS